MSVKKYLSGVFVICALGACKLKIDSVVNASDLFSAENKTIVANMNISVISCNNVEDDVEKIQTELKKRNIIANYIGCSNEAWNYYAKFSVPVVIVKSADAQPDVNAYIYFVYQNNELSVRTSNNMSAALKDDGSLYGDAEISSVEFDFSNDTLSDVKITSDLAFVNDKPVYNTSVTVAPYSKIHIKLSDVATKLLESSNVSYRVLQVTNSQE